MQRYQNYSRILATGAPAPGCDVLVTVHDLDPADIFSDNLDPPTPTANPFTAGADGYFDFYAPNGRYDITFSGTGIPVPYTWSDILLADFGVSGPGATEVTLGGSRESGPLATSTPEVFDFASFLPEGILLPAIGDVPVGATATAVIACQVPTGASAVVTIEDALANILATSAAFVDDTQMVVQSLNVPFQVDARQLFAKLTLTDGVDNPGLLMIGKLVFAQP